MQQRVINVLGGWPRFATPCTTRETAAPGFVVFEAWARCCRQLEIFSDTHAPHATFSTGLHLECSSVTATALCSCYTSPMPNRLHRYYGAGYSHFITTSCYRRLPLLGSPRNRDLFLRVLEQARCRYHFVVLGYVVMPEHVHLLISEPQRGDPSAVMKALKQGFARRLLARLRRAPDS